MEPALIVGEATTTVRASPTEVFDFVIDLERDRLCSRGMSRRPHRIVRDCRGHDLGKPTVATV
jgi:hypothetical protein